jgi:exosortase/archaeosortase family protein
MNRTQALTPHTLAASMLVCGSLILALHPVQWLALTWQDPAYHSAGQWVALATAGLALWSLSSPLSGPRKPTNKGWWLLLTSSLMRLASQVLAINLLGGLALVLDVYAIALLLHLNLRIRPLAPGWLAMLFAFCLPWTTLIQRTAGHGLQLLSAQLTAWLLNGLQIPTTLQGVQLIVNQQSVWVDLPCAGANSLTTLLMLFTACMAVKRPSLTHGITGLSLTLTCAVLANTARILLLTVGITHPDWVGGLDLTAQPWHDLTGIVTLSLFGLLPVLAWMSRLPEQPVTQAIPVSENKFDSNTLNIPPRGLHPALGAFFFLLAVGIVSIPPRPVDTSEPVAPVHLPVTLAGWVQKPVELSAKERAYFAQYGGEAVKARYGQHTLLLVRTRSPLRHLHNPTDCLRGMGYTVQDKGRRALPLPTTLLEARDPSGRRWQVAVSFVSDRGQVTHSVAEAVWLWFQAPGSQWTAVQRISPAHTDPTTQLAWDHAVVRALDLPIAQTQSKPLLTQNHSPQEEDPTR